MKTNEYIQELLVLGIGYLSEFRNDNYVKDMEVEDLYNLFGSQTKKYFKNEQEIKNATERLYSKFAEYVKDDVFNDGKVGDDIHCNVLNLSINALYLLIEENYFKKYSSEWRKAQRLMNSMEPKLRNESLRTDDKRIGFNNAYKLTSKLQEEYYAKL